MSETWTIQQLKAHTKKTSGTKSAYKDSIWKQLNEVCDGWVTEYKFHPTRKWRFDYYHPMGIGVEFDGLFSAKSRHTTVTGFSKDTEKLNAAAICGYTVMRYTALTYKNCKKEITELIASKKI